MNKILFLSLALFVAETVSAEEGLKPYLFFVNSGRKIGDKLVFPDLRCWDNFPRQNSQNAACL